MGSCPSTRDLRLRLKHSQDDRSSAEALWSAALVDLIASCGRGRGVDTAVNRLENASRLLPTSAELWSDLSAAYLARARPGRPEDFARSLAAAVRALRINPRLSEARFNHALALEENLLRSAARRAWRNGLAGLGAPGWVSEATDHRRRLEGPLRSDLWRNQRLFLEAAARSGDALVIRRIVHEFPWSSRIFAEEELLQSWAKAIVEGHLTEAAIQMHALRELGRALAAEGQPMVADVVTGLDVARVAAFSRRPLARALLDYAEGARLCSANQGNQGERLLLRARRDLVRVRSPMAEWAAYHLAVCAYQRFDFGTAAARAEDLLRRSGSRRHPALVGRANWMLGLASMGLGEPQKATKAYEDALRLLEVSRAEAEVGGILLLMAENRLYLGDRQEAWRLVRRGFEIAAVEGDERRLFTAFDKTADFALRESLPEAALAFRQEVFRLTLAGQPDPPGMAHALLRRAETRFALDQRSEALRDLAQAERAAASIGDESERSRRQVDILLAAGKVLAFEGPRQAIERLTRALDLAEGHDFRYPVPDILLARSRAALALGQTASAERDLLRGIAEFERQRSKVLSEDLRIAYFGQARELFDQLIDLQANRPGGAEMAFDTAERQRARVLLDRLAPGKAVPRRLAEIRRQFPRRMVLIAYASLPERLLVWVVRPGRDIHQVRLPIPSHRLDLLVRRLRERLRAEASAQVLESELGLLHELIVAPVLPVLQPEDQLIFIPDGSLHRVPFAALWNPRTRRFLVEDYALGVFPMASTSVAKRADKIEGSLLVVADPAFDRGAHPGLTALPGAEDEAAALQARFPDRVRILSGPDATRAVFLREAEGAAIIHVATHTWTHPDLPHLAQLLLAPSLSDAGTLSTAEIPNLHLPHTRLVFLAGCRTGAGPVGPEGVLSLARSFLAAGVPEVVFSLWDLEDRAVAELSSTFYRHRLREENALEALRQAQLSWLRRERRDPASVYTWGALQVSAVGALQ